MTEEQHVALHMLEDAMRHLIEATAWSPSPDDEASEATSEALTIISDRICCIIGLPKA